MKSRRLALVITRKASDCLLSRLPNLQSRLTAVAAPTLRQASRVVNTLRAGAPASGVEWLRETDIVWITARGGDPFLAGLLEAPAAWADKLVIWEGGGEPAPEGLRRAGASVASVIPIEDPDEVRCFVGGARRPVRETRRLVEGAGGRVVELRPGTETEAAAAIAAGTWLLIPHLETVQLCLRAAGLTPSAAAPVIEHLVERSLRAFLKAGRRSWRSPEKAEEQAEFRALLERLLLAHPALHARLREAARLALAQMGRSPDWLEAAPEARRAAAAQ